LATQKVAARTVRGGDVVANGFLYTVSTFEMSYE
jgi:hypothetical protein